MIKVRIYTMCLLIFYVHLLGAFGYFECTHDITKYTKAKPFEFVGKKTPLAVRFSTVGEFRNFLKDKTCLIFKKFYC